MTSTSGSHENDGPTATVSRVPSRTKVADEKLETKGDPEKQNGEQDEAADADEGVHVIYPSTTALALLTIGLCLVIFVVSGGYFGSGR